MKRVMVREFAKTPFFNNDESGIREEIAVWTGEARAETPTHYEVRKADFLRLFRQYKWIPKRGVWASAQPINE